ncbi:MAG: protein kinase [Leptolyngbya sp. SIO4C1]|nr:protein kinase [Leptolyngbya sp. SIO4C1]
MESELPDPNQGQRALAAIVVTDAVGFSARMSVDEEKTLRLIRRDLKLMAQLCKQFEGRVLKSTGDGLLMYFVSAVQSVSCAIAIQTSLAHAAAKSKEPLLHRIGIHLGDVFFSQSDVMGNGVNIAARLETQAKPGGICLSQVVYDVVRSRLTLNATPTGPLQLKNIQEPVSAYHISIGPARTARAAANARPAKVSTSQAPLPVGAKVAGRYRVKTVLGQGGFGISYLVEDSQRFNECCVLKEFRPIHDSGKALQKAVSLFKREAKTLYQIDHPQIPKFLACFTQAQRLFIVIEYIDGVNYLNLMQQRKRRDRLFSEAEMVPWLMQMLQVLDYLHRLNILHRDISPENVMYSQTRQRPVLIDFGLVNDAVNDMLEADEPGQPNRSATVAGKFGYSPPEQMRLGKCYPCSDLYSLGVTVLVLMTGQHPRDLMDRDSLEWRWQGQLPAGPAFKQILAQLTQPMPKARYQSAKAAIAALCAAFPTQADAAEMLQISAVPAAVVSPTTLIDDPQFMQQCREELSRCIGPMADVVIRETLDQHPQASPQELVQQIAAQLSQADQAEAFLQQMQPSLSALAATHLSSNSTALQSGDSTTTPDEAEISPEFLSRCRQVLTRCIGPMADLVIEEMLALHPHLSASALVQQLSAEIPDAQKAQEFRREMQG